MFSRNRRASKAENRISSETQSVRTSAPSFRTVFTRQIQTTNLPPLSAIQIQSFANITQLLLKRVLAGMSLRENAHIPY